MQTLKFDDGALVFKQGDDPRESRDAFYVITKGEAVVFKTDDEGGGYAAGLRTTRDSCSVARLLPP